MHITHQLLAILAVGASPALAQRAPASAPITDIRYEVTADSATAAARELVVAMSFRVASAQPVVLALPAWSPGHYVLLWFAARATRFGAEQGGRPVAWHKLDPETWQITPAGAGEVRVSFHYAADAIDRAVAWTAPNFAFFNGTNLFLYPVGQGFDWPARVTVHTTPGWRITTGMTPVAGAANTFTERNYHDLVDMPFYVGRFDVDSTRVAGRWVRWALYPAGAMTPERRDRTFGWLQKILPAHAAVFDTIPFRDYTVFVRSDTIVNGGGLEHQSSQVDEVLRSQLDGNFAGLYAHEMFHAWNVKRLRPADLVPYRYDDMQPTPWLWESEGVTDYYGLLAQTRTGLLDTTAAFNYLANAVATSEIAPGSVTDASLSSWIPWRDPVAGIYYAKGGLIGFLLDVLIRDGSGGERSLDDVMRTLYRTTYERGRGFTSDDWWGTVASAAGTPGAAAYYAEFSRRYVVGREPLPVDSILPLAGLRVERLTIHEPRIGITMLSDSAGASISNVTPGGAADAAGLRVGDRLVSVGDVPIVNDASFNDVRSRYAETTASALPVVVRRGAETLTVQVPVRLVGRYVTRVVVDPGATAKATGIRTGIFRRGGTR
ncbi:MAG TPA: PDZ domain-containing protein [Gemmatimonadaceae bacterium]|jgi:predicted metalloprotease with PDZ domain|nr:PDZ domain-containing protein [Gemmatimonadaceae bacterium]